jgi:hypothetical protein
MDAIALYRVEFLIALLTSPHATVSILNHFLQASCWVCTRCVPGRREEGEERWGEERVRDKRRGEGKSEGRREKAKNLEYEEREGSGCVGVVMMMMMKEILTRKEGTKDKRDRQTHRQTDRQRDRQTDRQTDSQSVSRTDRQT